MSDLVEDDEALKEFLIESYENLDSLDRDFVALESDPTAHSRITAIFRTIHTIKGTAGFFGFGRLEALTHAGESLLSLMRDGQRVLNAESTTALLSMVDSVRRMLASIEATGKEGSEPIDAIVARLNEITAVERASRRPPAAAPLPAASPAPSAPVPPAPAAVAPPPPPAAPSTAVTAPSTAVTAPSTPVAAPHPAAVATHPAPTPVPAAPAHDDAAAAEVRANAADTNVRVDVGLLDKLMNLVGELVLARNQILQYGATVKDQAFVSTTQRLNLLTTELQEGVMKTRMQPIGNIWNKFPRVVRDLALSEGKQIRLEMEGADTELDRTIIEAIKDPLTHVVRNAVDHGIETPEARQAKGKPPTGRLFLRAFHEGGQVNIEITDDGAGLDPDRIRQKALQKGLVTEDRLSRMGDREVANLIFVPGFSTKDKVTNVSGRGVGMDVVKTNVEKIGGTVDIQSRPGHGTTLKIKIPLTLAIIPALTVTTSGERFAIPQVSLLELVRLEGEQARHGVENIHGTPVLRLRGNLLPLVYLDRILGIGNSQAMNVEDDRVFNIVVLQADERQFGLVVDGVNDTEEIVVKPLGKELKGLNVFAGATIMGDGRVALILDVLGIAQRANVIAEIRDRGLVEKTASQSAHDDAKQSLLLFRVNGNGRMAIPLSLVARLEEFRVDTVETAGRQKVVQYRGEILPLIDVSLAVGGVGQKGSEENTLQVIVYSERGNSVGLVVDRIIDIVEENVTVRARVAGKGVLGAAVVQGKVTDFLDVHGTIRAVDPGFFERSEAAA